MRRMIDLCAGIGGFSLAARWCGVEAIGHVEIDNFCRSVLAKNFPEAKHHDDVRTFNSRMIGEWIGDGKLWLITAGYPCQPFSLAGQRRGQHDDRHIWPDIARIVADARPAWCLFENVVGHISLGLDDVLDDLAGIGYAAQAVVVPAVAVDAPHIRKRVWVVANANSVGFEDYAGELLLQQEEPALAVRGENGPGGYEATQPGLGAQAHGIPGWVARCGDWESGVTRTVPSYPGYTAKMKALGNSIVPQVALEFMRAMQEADDGALRRR